MHISFKRIPKSHLVAENPPCLIPGRGGGKAHTTAAETWEHASKSNARLCKMKSPNIGHCLNIKVSEEGKEVTCSIEKVLFSFR